MKKQLNSKPIRWRRSLSAQRGFSIIELLVAIIIIGILVAVLVPVVANRSEQARIARVNSDLQGLADALERVEIDTGYYVRLFALNDVLQGDGIGFKRDPRATAPFDLSDGLTDYVNAAPAPFYGFPDNNSLFISSSTGAFAENVTREDVINRLISAESKYDGTIIWNGAYINWQRDRNLYDGDLLRDGIPDDPWGNNYILFTAVKTINGVPVGGMLVEPNGQFVATNVGVRTQGGWTVSGIFPTNVFDRPTLLSLGPNGLPGNGTGGSGVGTFGSDDDYIRAFGR